MSCFHFICWETFAGHLNYLVKEGWDAQIGQGPHQWKATWFPFKDPPQPHTLNLLCRWDCIWVARLGGQRVVLDATWSFLGRSGWINLRNTRISLEIRKRYEFGHQPHRTFFLPVPSDLAWFGMLEAKSTGYPYGSLSFSWPWENEVYVPKCRGNPSWPATFVACLCF